MIRIMARGWTIIVLVIAIGFLAPNAAAQSDKYSNMATDINFHFPFLSFPVTLESLSQHWEWHVFRRPPATA
jgi:hypothetical protein